MQKLHQIWPHIETYGPPILAIGLAITVTLFNFYLRTISELRRLAKHLRRWGNAKPFESRTLPWVNLVDLWYGFLPLSKFDPILQGSRLGQEELDALRAFRKIFRWLLPSLFFLGALGLTLNYWLEKVGP
ncbi:MAG: hypothetical protein Q8J69_06575 [Sphingobacteriaceae bacterium]|nr:hypothetical protein [Sphingobacteriaceae bacterium]